MNVKQETDRKVLGFVYLVLAPIHVVMLGGLAAYYSPTSDEVAHLAAGVRILETGEVDSYLVNPPLAKFVAALPVFAQSPETSWKRFSDDPADRMEWQVGQDFIYANGPASLWYFVLARWACIPFSLIGLVVIFHWTSDLLGQRPGAASATLWAFAPSILGNGALVTPDVPCASLTIAATFMFYRWLQSQSWNATFLAAATLGLAHLTKTTCILLWPSFLLAWMCFAKPKCRSCCQFSLIVLGSVFVLNAGYGFDGTFKPLGSYSFVSRLFGGDRPHDAERGNRFSAMLGQAPVPFPEPYIVGIDLQRRDFEGGWRPMYSYMRGEQHLGGWWYYYFYAMLVKLPIGTLALLAVSLSITFTKPLDWKSVRQYGVLAIPTLTLLVTVSSQTGFSRYFRYLLPCLPFAFVVMGNCFSDGRSTWVRRLSILLVACAAVESVCVYPNSLAFFNISVGGPMKGHHHLLDSNVDWGQDLYRIKAWLEEHENHRPACLAYSGVVDPRVMDIRLDPIPREKGGVAPDLLPGYYIVSVNHIHGYDSPQDGWGYFLDLPVYERISPSIFVYHIETSSVPSE